MYKYINVTNKNKNLAPKVRLSQNDEIHASKHIQKKGSKAVEN